MLQTYIQYKKKNITPINEKIAMDSDDEQVVFFTATGPVYSFRKNDKFAKRLAQGIIVSLGLATTAEVANALGINRTTVLRNVQRYEDKGPEGFIDNRPNRSPYKFNKEKQQVVKRLLDKGSTIIAAAAEVGVSEGSVRRALRKGLIVRKTTQPDQTKKSVELKGPAKKYTAP